MLLFDENLSPELTSSLLDLYPGSRHVREVGLKSAADEQLWNYAKRTNHAIVTKDADFRQRSFLYGHPPKVIWIGLGNCSTGMIEQLLRAPHGEVTEFLKHPSKAFLAFTTLTRG